MKYFILFILIIFSFLNKANSNNHADKNSKLETISFEKILPLAFKNNKDILISINQNEANFLNHKASKSLLYPKLDVTTNIAEQSSNPNSANEDFSPRNFKLKITQNAEITISVTKANAILKVQELLTTEKHVQNTYCL